MDFQQFFSRFSTDWSKIGFKRHFLLNFKVSSQKIGDDLVILKPFVYFHANDWNFWWTFSSFSVDFQLIGRRVVSGNIL